MPATLSTPATSSRSDAGRSRSDAGGSKPPLFFVRRFVNRRSLITSRLRCANLAGDTPPPTAYFLASGVTVIFTRWPSRITTISTAWPILAASSA